MCLELGGFGSFVLVGPNGECVFIVSASGKSHALDDSLNATGNFFGSLGAAGCRNLKCATVGSDADVGGHFGRGLAALGAEPAIAMNHLAFDSAQDALNFGFGNAALGREVDDFWLALPLNEVLLVIDS